MRSRAGLGVLMALAACAAEPTVELREAPGILRVAAPAGWDGRPTAGGLWAAHAGAGTGGPARLRDPRGGAAVDVALLAREPGPGPAIVLSSDAAKALGIAAGRPRTLELTALRPVPVAPADAPGPRPTAQEGAPAIRPTGTQARAAAAPRAGPVSPAGRVAPAGPGAPAGRVAVVATFAQRANAEATVARLRAAGLPARIDRIERRNPLWQVVAGPATPGGEAALLADVKAAGFADAYLLAH